MIKLIVFDFGGVYFTYDYSKLMKEFSNELGISIDEAKKAWYARLDEFVKGECEENEFWSTFLSVINRDYDINKLHQTVIKQFKPIPKMQDLVDRLRRYYKVGMLTDQTIWLDEINKKYHFYHKFNPLIVSKNEGTQKSEEKMFRILIKKSNYKPSEIVLIDDILDYGEVAKKFGMHFIHYQNQSQLEKKLKGLGIKF